MSNVSSLFKVGENVIYNRKLATINQILQGKTGAPQYKITVEGEVRTVSERFLEKCPDQEENLFEYFNNNEYGTHKDYQTFYTAFCLNKPLEKNIYSYLGSKTIFNPFQYKPLLRLIDRGSDERLFIADEVGVGKTIETGIIISEFISRERLSYHTPILVVCPKSLGPKWQKEMKERFRLDFHHHNSESLTFMLKSIINDGVCPQKYMFSIVGLQLARRQEFLELFEKITEIRDTHLFGLIAIDESHHLRNSETDSNKLGHLLSRLTEMMLMLSATPLNLKSDDLFNQMNILNPDTIPDMTTFETLQKPVISLNNLRQKITINSLESKEEIKSIIEELKSDPLGEPIFNHATVKEFVQRLSEEQLFTTNEIVKYERLFVSLSPFYHLFTRTRKREAIQHQVKREVWELPISLSDPEMKFHDDLLDALFKYYTAKGFPPLILKFILNTHRRMVSSCIPAMKEYLEWCIRENRMMESDREIIDEIEDDSEISIVSLPIDLKQEFIRLLNQTPELERIDSKYNSFKEMLNKLIANPETPQVIVFSFFVRTIKYLSKRLSEDGFEVALLHGDIPLQDRYEIMDTFKAGKYKILLSSEVGGEGLDFQYCSALINYDLPYNPMRIEQRIGRIDRFGQKANKIIVANMFIKDTVDEEIYERLFKRIKLAEDGVGSLEPILGNQLLNLQNALISGELTDNQKEEISLRIEKAVEDAKLEMEQFEKVRKDLLSDDYLAQSLNNIGNNEFIIPEDIINLTEFVFTQDENCQFKKTKTNSGEMILSAQLVAEMERFIKIKGNEGGYGQLHQLLSPRKTFRVILDGSLAEQNPDHIFIPPVGYWSKFLIDKLKNEKRLNKVSGFRVHSSEVNMNKGRYLIFLFEIAIRGIKTEIEFLGLPVEIEANRVVKADYEGISRLLARVKGIGIENDTYDIDPNMYFDTARDYLSGIIEEKRKLLSEDNSYKVSSRIQALSKTMNIRVDNFKNIIDKHKQKSASEGKEPDMNYLRLTEAKIEKEKNQLNIKKKELESFLNLSLDHNLEGMIYLEVF